MAAVQATRTFTEEEGKDGDAYTEEESFQELDPNADAFRRAATALGVMGGFPAGLGVPGRKDLLLPVKMRQYYIEYVRASGRGPTGGIWDSAEGQEMLAYWNGPDGQARLKSVSAPDTMLKPLTEMVTAYSDVSTAECLKNHYGAVRNYFEVSTPVTQCANTVKKVNPTSSQCWICMTPIVHAQQNTDQFRNLELSPECEHVFPVAQALCFAGLYETQLFNELADEEQKRGKNPTQSRVDGYITGVTLEYQWAHRICNQVKNDSHFITYSPERGFAIEESPITDFLTKLKTTNSYGTGATFVKYILKVSGYKTIQAWEDKARKNMYNVSSTLLKYAQRSELTPEQHARVTLMSIRSFIALSSNCGGASEPPVPDNVLTRGRKALVGLNTDEPLAAAKQGIAIASEHIAGYINEISGTLGRTSGITAKGRANLNAKLLDLGLALREGFTPQVTYGLASDLRFKVLYYLKKQAGDTWNPEATAVWSDFQNWTNQVIIGKVYENMAIKSVELLRGEGGDFIILADKLNQRVSIRRPMVGVAPTRDVPEPPVVLETGEKETSLLMSYVDQNIIQVIRRGGVPYEAVLATPPTDPNPTKPKPNPSWFENDREEGGQSGGGDTERYAAFWSSKGTVGGLRKRRPLY
jgi:hypothetical protein